MKIPIKDAISSGTWFQCDNTFQKSFVFKIRILSFEKIANSVVKELQKTIEYDEGILWLMRIEVVIFLRLSYSSWEIANQIILFDQDGFKYNRLNNSSLETTKFGEEVGIYRFSGWSGVPPLQPKIKASGAIVFLLPDDDAAEYYLSVEGGNIQEV